jgi:hypothetical protein
MARIRTIKPEFFTSDDICALSPLARLLYIGLWCEADREGRLVWTPGVLKRRYLPDDDCDVDAVAAELLARGLVVPYGGEKDKKFAVIPSFTRHQHVNVKEAASKLPAPDGQSPQGKEGGRESESKGKEQEEGREGGASALPEDFKPSDEDLAWAGKQRPDLTPAMIEAETERFRNHALANGRTAHRWGPNWRNWIGKAHPPKEAGTSPRTVPTAEQDSDSQWRARLKSYRPGKFWLEGDWGPRPESGQSRVPRPVLEDWQARQQGGPA